LWVFTLKSCKTVKETRSEKGEDEEASRLESFMLILFYSPNSVKNRK